MFNPGGIESRSAVPGVVQGYPERAARAGLPCAAAGPLAKPAVMWFQSIPTAISMHSQFATGVASTQDRRRRTRTGYGGMAPLAAVHTECS